MMPTAVALVGGPAPYREALTATLEAAGFVVAARPGDAGALVICCTNEELWEQAANAALWTPTVVVITDLDIDAFVRALALGAGVVHLDTPTGVMVDVVVAAISGEALLPLAVSRALAAHVPPTAQHITSVELDDLEVRIAEALAAGQTVGQIASLLSYSDRTIRRKLQGIYLKLGVSDRTAAMKELKSRLPSD